ncbi:hypothetical protein Y1Q_0015611 [Alligator mississippiensis]|uniref:Secreted protein n=1 Tax=Alligator mississippiensis TaxID=8496 RepID=A0A151NNJ4_ALLMI|nr:hypothetical protein Y1Q_0015611 [Alligator mississippiensis]
MVLSPAVHLLPLLPRLSVVLCQLHSSSTPGFCINVILELRNLHPIKSSVKTSLLLNPPNHYKDQCQ